MRLLQKENREKNTETDRKSYMIAVPDTITDFPGERKMLFNLQCSRMLDFLDSSRGKNGGLEIRVQIGEKEYTAEIRLYTFDFPKMYRLQHIFKEIDIGRITGGQIGLLVEMEFTEDALASYHAQLKIIATVFPEAIAVIDQSSEKILSTKWVRMAAKSVVSPSPRYLYTVQAVSAHNGKVWLHTHGLNRCHLSELEILDSTKETYENQYNIIENTANRMLEDGELERKEPLYLAMVTEEIPLFVTLVDWEEAIKDYGRHHLGGRRDRKHGHNGDTCCIFCYTTVENLENKIYSPVKVYDEVMKDNPLYMITNKETARMKALALERLPYMKDMLGRPETIILVKIGLEVDEEYKENEDSKEHIWFELKEAKDGQLTAELTQEPYYIKNLHQGDICTYPESALTDWMVMTKEERYTPDDAYRMN